MDPRPEGPPLARVGQVMFSDLTSGKKVIIIFRITIRIQEVHLALVIRHLSLAEVKQMTASPLPRRLFTSAASLSHMLWDHLVTISAVQSHASRACYFLTYSGTWSTQCYKQVIIIASSRLPKIIRFFGGAGVMISIDSYSWDWAVEDEALTAIDQQLLLCYLLFGMSSWIP